jgi:4-amino-4-deoxy-L-arabinose transferase-like glycosyltransferase
MGELLAHPRTHFSVLCVLALFVIFAHLGEGHLANYDDCYYAQKAKEMVRDGSWITPTYESAPRLDNPPFFLWIMAGSFLVFGIRDYAAILPSAISGVLAVALLLRLAGRLGWSAFGAWCAAVVLLTTQYFLKYARHAMFDVFLTLIFLLCLWAYLDLLEGRRGRALVIGVLCGIGVMTKSVLGLFPLIVIVLHLLWTGRARQALTVGVVSTGVMLLTTLPWYGYQLTAHREQFLSEHVAWLLRSRGFEPRPGESWTDVFGYIKDIATYYWPWLPVAVSGVVIGMGRLRHAGGSRSGTSHEGTSPHPRSETDALKLLFLWLLVVVGVMSVGKEKKLWYIMSVFPCLALFAGLALDRWIGGAARKQRMLWGSALLLGGLALWLNLGPIRPFRLRDPGLYHIALVARTLVPAGAKVVNYDNGYWANQNLFLFYSDHGLTLPLADPREVRTQLDQGAFALVKANRITEVSAGDPIRYRAVVRAGPWALMAARDAEVVEIPSPDPFR